MPEERVYVTVLVALPLAVLVAVTVGGQAPSPVDATNDLVTRQDGCTGETVPQRCQRLALTNAAVPTSVAQLRQERPPNRTGPGRQPRPPMSADASRTDSNGFRVTVRNARNRRSADAEPPGRVGDAGRDTDLRGLTVVSRGGARSFDLDFTVGRNRSSVSGGSPPEPPDEFDTPLLYSDLETSTDSSAFDVRYDFDVENDLLSEYGASRNDVVVAVYRGSRWQTVDVGRRYRSGNETVVSTAGLGPGLIAVGLRHPNISVTGIEPRERPVLSNRSSRLELTVENRGSRDGTEQFEIAADDRTLATPSVSVPAGGQRTVTVPVRFQRPGETDIEAGEYESRIDVTQPKPEISVTELSRERTRIRTGENLTVEATVTNTGTAEGTGVVQFSAFGEPVTARQVTLAPGESRTVQFTQRFDSPGEYQVGVNDRTSAVTVTESSDQEGGSDEAGTATTANGSTGSDDPFQWGLLLLGAGVVLLFGLATAGRVLRR